MMANTMNPGREGTEQRREQPQTGTREAACSTMEGHHGQPEGLSSTITQKASDAWETTREGVQSAASSVASAAESTWDEVSSFVRRHPWACATFGCGIGYLVIRAVGGEDKVARGMSRSWRRSQEDHPSSTWRGDESGQPQSQGLTSSMAQRAGEAWEGAKQGAQGMASAVASRTGEALDTLGDWSREYPRATPATGLLIGLGCGFVAGWALGCQTSRSR
jgi:ElaB/YqjD/DUF883 family membrane-anchored ribosome-binding protein